MLNLVDYRRLPLAPSPNFHDGRGARGRNGWFRPWAAHVGGHRQVERPYVTIEIDSTHHGFPITFSLTPEDALALGNAIVEMAQFTQGESQGRPALADIE